MNQEKRQQRMDELTREIRGLVESYLEKNREQWEEASDATRELVEVMAEVQVNIHTWFCDWNEGGGGDDSDSVVREEQAEN